MQKGGVDSVESSLTALGMMSNLGSWNKVSKQQLTDIADAIKKAIRLSNRDLVQVPLVDGTIPYETNSKYGAAKVLFRPAPKGTGLIAGSSVRAVVEAAGITDIVCKVLGTNNKTSNARATFKALKQIETLAKKYQFLKAAKAK